MTSRGSIEDLTQALITKKRKAVEEGQQRVREQRRKLAEQEEMKRSAEDNCVQKQ